MGLLCALAFLAIPKGELRGVWMTTTGNDALTSRANIARSMQRLKRIGFNTVYVEVWKNGYTQFPSQALKKLIGADRHPALGGSRDLLGEMVGEAHRNGLACIAWFEYGFMAAHEGTDNHLLRKFPHWMTKTQDGALISSQNPFVWMNPMRPEPQRFLLDLITEAVEKYPIDGIQLDDRIAWPTSMGYDDFTKKAYTEEHGGSMPPSTSKDPRWVQWRANQVSDFAKRLHERMAQLDPLLIVSISPAVYPWSKENYACDWPEWLNRGWMTEFVPQVYRPSAASFEAEWKRQKAVGPDAGNRLVAGIMLESGGNPLPWSEVQKKLDAVEGHVLWFSRAVLDTHAEQLEAYYSMRGPARNPHATRNGKLSIRVTDEIKFKKTVLDTRVLSDGVAVGDVNRDGKLDILAGNVWYAAPAWNPHEIAPFVKLDPRSQYPNCFNSWADDLNKDGWIDQIVIGMPGDRAYWRENPKGKDEPWKEHPIWRSAGNESPHYADLFGNGKKVLVMAYDDAHLAWFEPDKDPYKEWICHNVSELKGAGSHRYSHGLGLGDLDGDKKNEVITKSGYFKAPRDPRIGPWLFVKADLGPDCAHMLPIDVNGDKKVDILSTSAHARGVWWHEALEGGRFKRNLIDETVSVTHSANLVPLGPSKAMNLITGKRKWGHPPGVDVGSEEPHWVVRYELEQTKEGPKWTRHIIDEDSGVGTQFVVQDVNGDGLLDIASSNKNGVFLFTQVAG
ncbi:MAG: family 10 glycosylhydrolase [Chlorobia bacterium]|nr:family 10 glycosylhydrolase [Fimbriimonadaceae bacterium]